MRYRSLVRVLPFLVGAHLATGCATSGALNGGAAEAATTGPLPQQGWRFVTREHVALWYHGLSFVLPAEDSLPLPMYDTTEQRRALDVARRSGIERTPVEAVAEQLTREFAGASAYQQLHFLPLYFDDAASLFNALRMWEQAGGDPRRAGSQRAAQAVALLSNMFQTPRQRRGVLDFAAALEEESRAYYQAYWRTRSGDLDPLAQAAARQWAALQDSLGMLLDYMELRGGEVLLTPSVGPEGRTVVVGPTLRTAVRTPAMGAVAANAGSEVTFSLLHELLYPLVNEAVREHVAPAQLRDLGETLLRSKAAIRAGAMVLERRAPGLLPEYRAYYLRMARRTGTDDTTFRNTFSLPLTLVAGLGTVVEQALAGI